MRAKPGKYGIKVWCCSCVDCTYICNLQVYCGKTEGKVEKGQGKRVVGDLIKPFTMAWRELTVDNFFTSVELCEELWEKKTILTGTVRHNKTNVPPEFKNSKGRKQNTTLVGHAGVKTLTSFINGKKKKPVILLSSATPECDEPGKKPAIVQHYNNTKGAVDAGDFITRKTNCVRKTRVWTKKLIMELISVACLNASCLFKKKYPLVAKGNHRWRSDFLKELCNELILENVKAREKSTKIRQKLKLQMQNFTSQTFESYTKTLNYATAASMCLKQLRHVLLVYQVFVCNIFAKEA
ncbi:piggyBac transposable element-derived protein 4-like [Aedes albopictus]|uniref:PiggyBac transposable element-derived protein domain-containing protein n=1 Tax=Aedes albopictus TaxID=7160 RepID=A0ABM1Y8R9_AEDAL